MTDNSDRNELREQAREDIEELPAETALGNADPAAPSDTDPRTYEAENESRYASDGAQSPESQA